MERGEVTPARGLFDGLSVFRPFAADHNQLSNVPTWAQAAQSEDITLLSREAQQTRRVS